MDHYTRRMVLPVAEVIWHIQKRSETEFKYGSGPQRDMIHGFKVGLTSLRLRTFARDIDNLRCAHCGIEGKFFSIDSHRNQLAYTHLNLYGIDHNNEEVLMTCDHILARGLGGADDLSNTQVLCTHCNSKKSKQESRVSNEIRRELNILMESVKIYNILHSHKTKSLLDKWVVIMNNPASYTSDDTCRKLALDIF